MSQLLASSHYFLNPTYERRNGRVDASAPLHAAPVGPARLRRRDDGARDADDGVGGGEQRAAGVAAAEARRAAVPAEALERQVPRRRRGRCCR